MKRSIIAATTLLTAITAYAPGAEATVRGRTDLIAVHQWDGHPDYSVNRLRAFRLNGSVAWTRDELGVWSPDLQWVAYFRRESDNAVSLFRSRPNGTDEQQIAELRAGYVYTSAPSWSADGAHIVYAASTGNLPYNSHLEVAAVDGSGVIQLTPESGFDQAPAWSPDGTSIAFIRCEAGGVPFTGFISCRQGDLHVIDPDGSNVTRLTATSRSEADVAWAPDGRRLAYTCDGHSYKWDTRGGICLFNIDSERARRVYPSISKAFGPIWSPDGRRIAFQFFPKNEENVDSELAVIKSDGRDFRTITNNRLEDQPTQWLAR